MKPSFKTTTLIAAIGMIGYTLYIITRYVVYEFHLMAYNFNLWSDIRTRVAFDVLPLCLIIACIALYKQRPIMSASKPFRWLTIGLFAAMLGTLAFCYPYTIQVCGIKFLFPSIYWRVLMLIAGTVWLFMLRKQPTEEASSRSYQVTLIIAMCILALPIVMELISGLSLLTNGSIRCFNSWAFKSWTKWIAPILPLIHLVFPSIQRINYTRNSHCTPGSFDERTFNRNRIITLVFVSITVITAVAFVGCLACYRFLHGYYHHAFGLIDDIAVICVCTTIIFGLLSWIMLAVMAFRQLPNPRGYKIYNIACQCLTWGNLIAAIVLSIFEEPIAETFAILALISFLAFFITQSIRVISYKIPNTTQL